MTRHEYKLREAAHLPPELLEAAAQSEENEAKERAAEETIRIAQTGRIDHHQYTKDPELIEREINKIRATYGLEDSSE